MTPVAKLMLLSLLLPLAACKKVIDVTLNDAGPRIVITGDVTNAPGPYIVRIAQSVSVNNDNTFPPVRGARVIITATDGTRDSLAETTPGQYATTLVWPGKPGITYTLSVNTAGQTYTASSTMPAPVPLDSVGFQNDPTGFRGKNQIEAIPYYQDPAGRDNYYQFTVSINGMPYTKRVFVSSDRLSDGKYVSRRLNTDSALKAGNTLLLSMYCIDKPVYDYLSTLNDVSDAGSFSSVTPANPGSNLSNEALGYFSAHTIQFKQVLVH